MDKLFASPLGDIRGFTFDENVAAVFPDMLVRSIPGYQSIIAQTGLLAGRFAQEGTMLYDLGCSLGATSLSMQSQTNARQCKIIAVDNSRAMLNELRRTQPMALKDQQTPIECRHEDLTQTGIENASVVALNFTLQFIAPQYRQALCANIARGLNDGGILLLSEKVVFEEKELNDLHIEMYHSFKSANGYSDLEISQKRTALENVLIPDTLQQHRDRLISAGFREVTVWFQCFNFISLIALK